MKIQNSVAFVTGANRGLGLATVQALLHAGARKVYAAARDPASITLPGVVPIRLDVTQPDQVAAAVAACGDVEILFNNAGIVRGGSILSPETVDGIRAEFETNFFGPLALSQSFAPVLARNGGGAIVNILSVLSWISFPQIGGYCASKSAAWSLTNALRNDLRAQGTLVVGLHVGYMDTDMTSSYDVPKARPQDVAEQALAAIEAGREEVLADEPSRQVKQGLSAEPGAYLGMPG